MMVKRILSLTIAALLTYAAWHVAQAWLTYYKFRDAVVDASQTSGERSVDTLRDRILELAGEYSVPVAADSFTIRRDEHNHTFIDGSYEQPLELLPGFSYRWSFSWHTDTFFVKPVKLNDIVPPK